MEELKSSRSVCWKSQSFCCQYEDRCQTCPPAQPWPPPKPPIPPEHLFKEAFVQTKNDLEQTQSRQHKVILVEGTANRPCSADKTDIQRVDCAVEVVEKRNFQQKCKCSSGNHDNHLSDGGLVRAGWKEARMVHP